MEYPRKPVAPKLPQGCVDKEALDNHRHQLDIYEKELELYQARKRQYAEELKERLKKEREKNEKELTEYYEKRGLNPNCEFVQKMYSIAYEIGHAYGMNLILCYMDDLLPLYDLYNDK